jgi:uncharacterized protein YjdB
MIGILWGKTCSPILLTDHEWHEVKLARDFDQVIFFWDDVIELSVDGRGFESLGRVGIGSINDRVIIDDVSVTGRTGYIKVDSIEMDNNEAEIIIGDSLQLTASLFPLEADIQIIRWTSSRESVASVEQDGMVRAHQTGTAVITARSADGGFTTNCNFTVIPVPVSGLFFTSDTIFVDVGTIVTPDYSITPDNASDKSVVWNTADKTIANVNSLGRVKGMSPGTDLLPVIICRGGCISSKLKPGSLF